MSYVFTSESVSPGHPDKLCDQISDLLLDHILSYEPNARGAFECFATNNKLIVGGECRVKDWGILEHALLEKKIREHIKYIGYDDDGFRWSDVNIEFIFHKQSPDIAMGVDESAEKPEGAGDQGIMFGYACTETPHYMPSAIYYSHKILETIWDLSKAGKIIPLGPDAKSQVSLVYSDAGEVLEADSVTLSIQHPAATSVPEIRKTIIPIIESILPSKKLPSPERIFINPTGKFVIGGPVSDTGLTGRKIIVDTYGGYAPHGGGAFSGKDPTKVDRSAAYMARFLAKNIVASGLASKCTIQLSFVIGISYPTSIFIDCHNTLKQGIKTQDIINFIKTNTDLTPKGIRTFLKLNNPIYLKTATFGHFGRQPHNGYFTWEELSLVSKIKSAFGI
jgi:S-adenosylmethionine synthetase